MSDNSSPASEAPAALAERARFLQQAIQLAYQNVNLSGGRPFGAVLTRAGKVVATGVNGFLASGDPTAHAELEALRAAGTSGELAAPGQLVMYASGQPCPMCLAAMHLAGVKAAYYAYSNEDGAPHGLSSGALYEELRKPLSDQRLRFVHQPTRVAGLDLYAAWDNLRAGTGD